MGFSDFNFEETDQVIGAGVSIISSGLAIQVKVEKVKEGSSLCFSGRDFSLFYDQDRGGFLYNDKFYVYELAVGDPFDLRITRAGLEVKQGDRFIALSESTPSSSYIVVDLEKENMSDLKPIIEREAPPYLKDILDICMSDGPDSKSVLGAITVAFWRGVENHKSSPEWCRSEQGKRIDAELRRMGGSSEDNV